MAMLKDESKRAMSALLDATADERRRVRQLIKEGRPEQAEDDPIRHRTFSIKSGASIGVRESVAGTNDFQPVSFLVDGAAARRAVGRIEVVLDGTSESGTGFLISPHLLMTNQHVLQDESFARAAEVIFDDEVDGRGQPFGETVYMLDPNRFALFSPEIELDYAIVAIGRRVKGAGSAEQFRYLALSNAPDKHQKGMSVNIIQHPRGRKKTIAIRNNYLLERQDRFLIYNTDTLPGSSGAPVLNDRWEVIALHHYGEGDNEHDAPEDRIRVNNAGIRASAIYEDLKKRSEAMADGPQKSLLVEALSLYASNAPPLMRLERRPPPLPAMPATPAQPESYSPSRDEVHMDADNRSATLVIPLEVTIRIGDGGLRAPIEETTPAPASIRKLSRPSPERARIDRDYSNRNGFDRDFIEGLAIDLAAITAPVRDQAAELKDGRVDKVLDYQNFSVVIHADRRMALVTATNIDGPTYIPLARDKKKKKSEPEREAWYLDPRIAENHIIVDDFYLAWSALFDRGHLTRRADPTWGDGAAKAETDTFHFTNCTPQHFLFNQGTDMWQGLEQYVLEHGVNAVEGARVSVLQGPVFNDEIDPFAHSVRVPSAFWKLVAWNGATGLKAVALVADQTDVIDINRGYESPVKAAHPVDQFVVTVPHLEELTGLDLSMFREIDTAGGAMPTPGERKKIVTRFQDIPLV